MTDPPKSPAAAIRRRQGDDIRTLRKSRELSQQALATQVGVTKAAVSDWERGQSTPRQHHQVAIARTLDVTWLSLFGLDGEAAA